MSSMYKLSKCKRWPIIIGKQANKGIALSSYDKEKSFENASYHDPDGKKIREFLLITHLFKLRFFS